MLPRKTPKGILPAGPRLMVAVTLWYFRLHLRLCGQDITTDQPLLVNDQHVSTLSPVHEVFLVYFF